MRRFLDICLALLGVAFLLLHFHGAEAKQPQLTAEVEARIAELTDWVVAHSTYQKVNPPAVVFLPRPTINYVFYHPTEKGYTGQTHVWAVYMPWLMVLPDDFKIGSDDYIIVHELVHHLQQASGKEFTCIAEKEAEAYDLQIKFVDETGVGDKPNPLFLMTLRCDLH